jgi:hypothetical protein
MYLIINEQRHTVSRRMVTNDTVKYLSVSPAPAELTGVIRMYHNNGDLLSEDVCEDYSRRFVTGSLVTLTNQPKPSPAPVQPTLEEQMAQAIKEGVDSV